MSVTLSHKVELRPNNKQKTFFEKAFGCARLAWNWGLTEWERQYAEGKKPTGRSIKKCFNAIKDEQFPFVNEVGRFATLQQFDFLNTAYSRKRYAMYGAPRFKKRKECTGSYYMGNDKFYLSDHNENSGNLKNAPHNKKKKYQYLRVPKLGFVKMMERLRFDGKVNSVTISKKAGKYYASFSVTMSYEEYLRTHPAMRKQRGGFSVGVDVGVKSYATLSDGTKYDRPSTAKEEKRIAIMQKKMSRRVRPKTRQDAINGKEMSYRCKKALLSYAKIHAKIARKNRHFIHTLTTRLISSYDIIGIEHLDTKHMKETKVRRVNGMMQSARLYQLRELLEYKSEINGNQLVQADRWFPSSKRCCVCGNIKHDLKLHNRIYRCECCGAVIDRDVNAAINLSQLAEEQIGGSTPEFTPVDSGCPSSHHACSGKFEDEAGMSAEITTHKSAMVSNDTTGRGVSGFRECATALNCKLILPYQNYFVTLPPMTNPIKPQMVQFPTHTHEYLRQIMLDYAEWMCISPLEKEVCMVDEYLSARISEKKQYHYDTHRQFREKDTEVLYKCFHHLRHKIGHALHHLPSEHNDENAEMMYELLGVVTRYIPRRTILERIGLSDDQWCVRRTTKRKVHFKSTELDDLRSVLQLALSKYSEAINRLLAEP